MKIAVIMGGTSSEREISLRSGNAILNSLKRQGFDAYGIDITEENQIGAFLENEFDLAFLALHGGNGENGKIQALLDMLGKKYTGSPYLASAISMNKKRTKFIAKNIGIRTIKEFNSIEEIDTYPVMIKPNQDGSSFGIHKCNNFEEAKQAILELKNDYIIEEFISGEELTVAVWNNIPLGVIRIKPVTSDIYDYNAKYAEGGSIHEYPAQIDKISYDEAMNFATKLHKELEMSGVSRSDFILSNNKVYFLEVNSTPGMTETSLVPDLLKLNGYTFDDFTRKTVESFGIFLEKK